MGSPGIVAKVYIRTPGIVPQSYRSHRSSGLGYGDLTELTEFPGTVLEVPQNPPKFRPLWHGRT